MKTPETLVRLVNANHGTAYQLGPRFSRGEYGAWKLLDEHGRGIAVLKPLPDAWAYPSLHRATRFKEELAQRGYPTARYLHQGEMLGGGAYVVQELVEGEIADPLTLGRLEDAIRLLDLQRDLASPSMGDWSWSEHMRAALFEDSLGWWVEARRIPDTEPLLARLKRLLEPCRATRLPSGDAVHGDFCPGNLLCQGDRVQAVIDMESMGPGSVVLDLGVLLYAWIGLRARSAACPEGGEMLRGHIVSIGGEQGLRLGLAARTLGMIAFSSRRESPGESLMVGEAATALLEDQDGRTPLS